MMPAGAATLPTRKANVRSGRPALTFLLPQRGLHLSDLFPQGGLHSSDFLVQGGLGAQ